MVQPVKNKVTSANLSNSRHDHHNLIKSKRLHVTTRRPLVKMYLQTEGWGPTQIAKQISKDKKVTVARQTIADDINVLTAENEQWENQQALVGWMATVRDRHKSLLVEVAYLQSKLANHRFFESIQDKPQHTQQETNFLQLHNNDFLEIKSYLDIQKSLNSATTALTEMMERNTLYKKTAQYAKFFSLHQAEEYK